MTSIWISSSPGELRIAVTDEIDLFDFGLWRPGAPDGFGDIHLGRVITHRPAMGGAFIELINGNGFLADNAGAKNLHDGDAVIARVIRSAQGGKDVRLDARQDFGIDKKSLKQTTPHIIVKGPSPLEEILNRWHQLPVYLDDLHLTSLFPEQYRKRIQPKARTLPLEIEPLIDHLKEDIIDLPAGMRASITPTPALIAIDVDSAAQTNENKTKLRAQFDANRLIIPPLLYQLRLRNLSGAILLDLAGLPIRKRQLLQNDFIIALTNDPLRPKFLGFTQLGLAEMTRPRQRPPLYELLTSYHGKALAILNDMEKQLKNLEISSVIGKNIVLNASIPLRQALENDPWALNEFKRRNLCSITLESKPDLSENQWRICNVSYE
ncbi:MAG: ribonuclease E/G [Commensalibacter sp.]